MIATLGETSAFAIDMNRTQSHRIIEHALRVRAEVSVWPCTQADERPVAGPLAGRTDAGLVIQATHDSAPLPLVSAYCEAGFRLDDARFMFSTHIIHVAQDENACRLEIALPDSIQVLQRRRYQRRELRGNATIKIAPPNGAARGAIAAALLNIGPGGLACRCDRASADRFGIDAPVRVSFALREGNMAFEFDAHIRGKTSGAEPEHLILAVAFAPNSEQREDIERLTEALYGPVTALARG